MAQAIIRLAHRALSPYPTAVLLVSLVGCRARRFAAWVRQYQHAALVIETLVRGFLCRCRFKKLRAEVMMGRLFHPRYIDRQPHRTTMCASRRQGGGSEV